MRTFFVSLITLAALLAAVPALADTGASCTTPWGNKVVADGQAISSQPYFTNGVYSGSVVVPMMRCSDGTWLTCDYLGNNCSLNGTPVSTPTNPTPIPPTEKQHIPITSGPILCSTLYAPVCGTDGKTYPNSCNASVSGTTIAHTGSCTGDATTQPPTLSQKPPQTGMLCPDLYAPVCGVNGKTYPNSCNASAAGTAISHPGPCEGVSSSQTQTPLFKFAQIQTQQGQGSTASNTNQGIERARTSIKRSLVLLDAAITRAEGLVARIQSRIAKATGDTTAAQTELQKAIAALQRARALLTEFQVGVDSATGTTPEDAFGKAKITIHDVNAYLRNSMIEISRIARELANQ